MQKWIAVLCAMSMLIAPYALFADDEGVGTKPPEYLTKKEYVDTTGDTKEPASFDWTTGKGRKDWVLKWAVDDNYLKKTPGMFLRGVENVALGWTEILTQPFRWPKNSPFVTGLLSGLIMGPVNAVLRTSSGALDIATCWVPFWHGLPMRKPVLGLHDVHNYGTLEDVPSYDHQTKRRMFNWLKEEY
jgi:putative exosortase-associated protein (TIGR04073 family)